MVSSENEAAAPSMTFHDDLTAEAQGAPEPISRATPDEVGALGPDEKLFDLSAGLGRFLATFGSDDMGSSEPHQG